MDVVGVVLADEIASAMEFMTSKFGPPVLPNLTVSPIPGNFGQGFPGLIYLSTSSYLKTAATMKPGYQMQRQALLDDMLPAHETAHQWWGNILTPGKGPGGNVVYRSAQGEEIPCPGFPKLVRRRELAGRLGSLAALALRCLVGRCVGGDRIRT